MISVRKYLVVVLRNTNPVSLHLQCGITLYSKYKNETQIRNWDKWGGIYVVVLLLLFLLLLSLLFLLLLLLNKIKTCFSRFVFAVYTFGLCH